MDLWNQIILPPPPTFTFKATNQELDLNKLRNALQEAIRHFKDQGFLFREAALLSRITYRMKMKFRSAKDFKALEKVSHALDRYFKCNLTSYLKLLLSLVPSKYGESVYLPTKNMFDYILVRLQGLAKLLERIHDSCKIAAYLTNKRLSIGHFWKLFVIVFALISRVYVLVKFNCQFICDLYAKLYMHSNHLKNPGTQWLPTDSQLPADLREWLGVDWVYEEEFIDLTNEITIPSVLDFFDLCNDNEDEIEIGDEYVLIDDELNDFRKLKQKKLEKSGLLDLSKEERKQQAMDLRNHKKQGKRVRRTSMRGFSNDIDCGEVITIDESFTIGVLEDLKEIFNSNEDLKRKNINQNLFGYDSSENHKITKDLKCTSNNSVEILSDSGIKTITTKDKNPVKIIEDNKDSNFLALEVVDNKSDSTLNETKNEVFGTINNKNVISLKEPDNKKNLIMVDDAQSSDESVQIIKETECEINKFIKSKKETKNIKNTKKRKSSKIYSDTITNNSPSKSVQIITESESKIHSEHTVGKNKKKLQKLNNKKAREKIHSDTIAKLNSNKSVQIIKKKDTKKTSKKQKFSKASTILKNSLDKSVQIIEDTENEINLDNTVPKSKNKKQKLNKTKNTSKKRNFSDTSLDIFESITPKKFKPNLVTSTPIVDFSRNKMFATDNKKRKMDLLTPERNTHKKKNKSFKTSNLNNSKNGKSISLDGSAAGLSGVKTKKEKRRNSSVYRKEASSIINKEAKAEKKKNRRRKNKKIVI